MPLVVTVAAPGAKSIMASVRTIESLGGLGIKVRV